jgi:hypothetical protein
VKKHMSVALACTFWLLVGVAHAAPISINFVPNDTVAFGPSGCCAIVGIDISGLGAGAPPHLGAFDFDITFRPTVVSLQQVWFENPLLGFVDELGSPDFMRWTSSSDHTTLIPGSPGAGEAVTIATFVGPGTVNLVEVSLLLSLDSQPTDFRLATLLFEVQGAYGTASPLDLKINAIGDEGGNPLSAEATSGSISVVPEPSSLLLLGTGFASMMLWRLRSLGVSRADPPTGAADKMF